MHKLLSSAVGFFFFLFFSFPWQWIARLCDPLQHPSSFLNLRVWSFFSNQLFLLFCLSFFFHSFAAPTFAYKWNPHIDWCLSSLLCVFICIDFCFLSTFCLWTQYFIFLVKVFLIFYDVNLFLKISKTHKIWISSPPSSTRFNILRAPPFIFSSNLFNFQIRCSNNFFGFAPQTFPTLRDVISTKMSEIRKAAAFTRLATVFGVFGLNEWGRNGRRPKWD